MMQSTRRQVLRGLCLGAGTSVLSPFLQKVHAQAAGKTPQTRFVFVLQNNGFQPDAAQPASLPRNKSERHGPDRPRVVTLKDQSLSNDLKPLTPLLDRVTILQRLNGVHSRPYHGGGFSALSGSLAAKRRPLAETIDSAIGQAFPGVFPMIGLGLNQDSHNDRGAVYCCSAAGPNKAIATQCNPNAAYSTLFGSVATGKEVSDFNAKTDLLDFMAQDLKRVRREVASPERAKLDGYLEAFEAMGQRQRDLSQMNEQLKLIAPKHDARFTSDNEVVRLRTQFDLAAAALISGLSNVVTICSGLCAPVGYFRGLGIEAHQHKIGHGASDKGRSARQLYAIIRSHHLQRVAELVRTLEKVPEGNGTMMDHTVIVYTSDAGHSHHSSGEEWPFVLIGSAGGKLKTGQFVEYPGFGKAGNRTINALYCTLLHAAGAPRDHFNLDGGLKNVDRPGPLHELLA